MDSFLTVLNAQGGVLAENDDFVDPDQPLVLHHSDSRLVFTFPAAGDYILRVRDTQGKGGDEYAYRLVVAPPKPDCVLRMVPDMQRVAKGDSVVVTVTADRRDGFGSEINLAVQNLPPGFTASDAVIPAGQPQAKLTITAPPDAPLTVFAPAIVGTATLNNQPFTRTAVGAEDVMQAFSYRHVVPTKEFVVAVIETSLFGLSTNAPPQGRPGGQAGRRGAGRGQGGPQGRGQVPDQSGRGGRPGGDHREDGPHPRRQGRSADHDHASPRRPRPAGRST